MFKNLYFSTKMNCDKITCNICSFITLRITTPWKKKQSTFSPCHFKWNHFSNVVSIPKKDGMLRETLVLWLLLNALIFCLYLNNISLVQRIKKSNNNNKSWKKIRTFSKLISTYSKVICISQYKKVSKSVLSWPSLIKFLVVSF